MSIMYLKPFFNLTLKNVAGVSPNDGSHLLLRHPIPVKRGAGRNLSWCKTGTQRRTYNVLYAHVKSYHH